MLIISTDGAIAVGRCKELFDEKMHWFGESVRGAAHVSLSHIEELQAGGGHQWPLARSRGPFPGVWPESFFIICFLSLGYNDADGK